ncbi:YfhO family protein [Nitrospirota bacterium]
MRISLNNKIKEIGWLLLFILLSCLFFHEAFTNDVLLAANGDGDNYFYPIHTLVHKLLNQGELPLWNPYIFSGMPLLATNQTGALYPPTLISILLMGPKLSFNFDSILHYALTGYFMFLYIRYLTRHSFVAFVAGVSLAFVGYLYVAPSHITVLRATPWLPLMLLMLEKMATPSANTGHPYRALLRPDISYALLLAITIGFGVLAGHAQSTFYFLILSGAYAIYLLYPMNRSERIRFIALGSGAIVMGLLISLPQVLSTMELNSLSWRSERTYEFFSEFPFHISTITGLLFPGTYDPYPKSYTGIYTCLMGMGGAVLLWKSSTMARFWTVIAVVAFILSLGDATPLYRLMYHVPGYNMFRAPERHWYEIFFALCVLSALGLNSLITNEKRRECAIWLSGGAALTIVIVLVSRTGIPFFAHLKPSIYVFIPIALAISMAAWTYMLWKRPNKWLIYAALGFILVEALLYKPDLLAWDKYNQHSLQDSPAPVMKLMKGRSLERMAFYTHYYQELSVSFNAPIMYEVSILGGYDPLLLKSYYYLTHIGQAGKFGDAPSDLIEHGLFLRMLGARVVIACDKGMLKASRNPKYKLLGALNECIAFENNDALPRAYTVERAYGAETPGETKMKLGAENFDPAFHVILRQDDLKELNRESFAPGNVFITSDSEHEVIIDTLFFGDGLLILADQHYPGWKAYVDGTETKVLRANEILRAVPVPAGKHTVTFRYEPAYFIPSLIFSSIMLGVFLIIGIFGLWKDNEVLPETTNHPRQRKL